MRHIDFSPSAQRMREALARNAAIAERERYIAQLEAEARWEETRAMILRGALECAALFAVLAAFTFLAVM